MSADEQHVIERLEKQDAFEITRADTLDVKASIALVLITSLATQTATLLSAPAPDHTLQLFSACLLASAGVLAIFELWPRDYDCDDAVAVATWVQQLREHYANDPEIESKVAIAVADGRIARAKGRVECNAKLNENKGWLLDWCFRCTGLAFLINLASLLLRVLPRTYPF